MNALLTSLRHAPSLQPSPLLSPRFWPCLVTSREKSRRSTRLKQDAKKARLKAIKASSPQVPPKPTFMMRLRRVLFKGRAKPQSIGISTKQQAGCLAWPSRLLQVGNPAEPQDDVFRITASNFLLSLPEAINILRKFYDRTVYDDPKAPVHMRLDLNMNADLEGREFVESVKQMMVLPHPFEYGKRRVVMAFCKNADVQMAAREAGAEYAGDEEAIRRIRRGEFKTEEVDYFVSHVELLKELGTIRGILKDKLPSHTNGLLGVDVIPLVRHFRNAITAHVKRDDSKPDWGLCSILIGKLEMPDEQLHENVSFAIKKICELRPQALSLGHFIHRAAFVAPDLKAFFPWKFEPYAPPIPDNDGALVSMVDEESGRRGKKKKKKLL